MTALTQTQLEAKLGAVDLVEWQKDMADSARLRADYLVYTALVSQLTDNAPASIVLDNSLIGVPVWAYSDVGFYTLTLVGGFPMGKTWIEFPRACLNGGDQAVTITIIQNTANTLEFYVLDGSSNPAELNVNDFPLEIRVYP